jgi:hypothetical protein
VVNDAVTENFAGVVQAKLNGNQTFDVLSVDMFTPFTVGATYTVTTLKPNDPRIKFTSVNMARAAWLYSTYMPVVNAAADKNVQAAALQLAVWDVIHDGGDGLSQGKVRAASNVDANTQRVYALATAMIVTSVGQASNAAAILMNTEGPNGPQTVITSALALKPRPVMIDPVPMVLIRNAPFAADDQRRASHL